MNDEQQYWLLEKDPAKVAAAMRDRIERYADRMESSGRADIWRRMSRLYFSRDADSSLRSTMVQSGGAQGEWIGTRDNYLGRLVRSVGIMITSSRPSYTTRSIADGAGTIQQVNAGDKLCDFMISKRNAERQAKRAELYMGLYGMGWIWVQWDERAGKKLGTEVLDDAGNPLKDEQGNVVLLPKGAPVDPGVRTRDRFEGDIRFAAKRPDEVVYDVDLDETCDHEWVIVAEQVSRHKIAQQYPAERDFIMNARADTKLDKLRQRLNLGGEGEKKTTNGDIVTVYKCFAPPSCVLPDGRYLMLLGSRLIADDRALYDDFSVYEMTAEYEPGTKNGHSYLWDLCGMQQCVDGTNVATTTAVENTGKIVLFIPEGSNLDTSKEAMLLPYHVVRGTVPPAFVTAGAAALAPLMETKNAMKGDMTSLAGTNDVAMGDASKSQSGEALKTMSALAQQSVSSMQEAYADASGAAMFGGLKRYRTFASEETIARICGKGRAVDAKAFKDELANIEDIDTEMGPAELRFTAGKRDFANRMWDSRAITSPEAYLEALATGKVTPMLERPQSQRQLIEAENEMLRAGKPCFVLDTDDHRQHILGHSPVGDDIKLRGPMIDPATGQPMLVPQMGPDGLPMIDPATGQPAMVPKMNPVIDVQAAHIMEHVNALRAMDPDLASALSTQAVPGQELAQQAGIQQQANAMQQPNTQGTSAPNEPPPPGEGQNINPAPMPA